MRSEKKLVLAGLLLDELKELLTVNSVSKEFPSYRAKQIYEWICRGALSFEEMSNLPIALRKELAEKYHLIAGEPITELVDPDGTLKLALRLDDGFVIESVILADGEGRKTACLSSQAGCPMGCVFCKTGTLGFYRNLSAREITGQFLQLKKRAPNISHIVVMGMGEPLLNPEELRKALLFFTEEEGLNISKRRITLSTCGIKNGILELAEQGPDVRLALSLTTAREGLRERLMPSVTDSLASLKKVLLVYNKKHRITLEMVLLGGINTTTADADAAADFSRGLDVMINLIHWNPVEGLQFDGLPLKPPSSREIADFARALESRGLKVTVRMGKGCSIGGACGQLGSKVNESK